MKFLSTRGESAEASFADAVVQGLAPDGGLYMPEEIPSLDIAELTTGSQLHDIGTNFLFPYVSEWIDLESFGGLVEEVLNFDIPLVEVEPNIYALELFHGPTLAFKDVGARFMGRVLPRCNVNTENVVVLVATSGDTGGAVANGLFQVPGVEVVILYPKGKVSPLQERQFASLGDNVSTIAIDGYFDDCQHLVKAAFNDTELTENIRLTTANSINIARWMPQSVYYLHMYAQLGEEAVISVPSGNFGNLTAGLLAYKSGMPARRFIASCNANDTVPKYLITGQYTPKASIRTIANAMDVGAPSNFERLLHLFDSDWDAIRSVLTGATYLDDQISEAIINCYRETGYLLDPHGACGYLGLKEQLREGETGVFLATAHPAKFEEVYGELNMSRPMHQRLEILRDKKVLSTEMQPDQAQLKKYLLRAFAD